ncbi:barstar family protein [Planosporangium sp. 12N6]|uniref:barstar family protein n=1 Tax=Planosporangium spinosum TaxID=3402278 RepID=UPI003CF9379C
MTGPAERHLRVVTGTPPTPATHVDGEACHSRAGLFAEWAARLSFPEYFGHNWDALSDCLADLLDARPLTLVVDDAARLLADEPPGQLAILLGILDDRAAGGRLEVVLHCRPDQEESLRRRLTTATPRA